MNIETLREYCLTKKAVTETFPFDESTLVFKVGGKMFLLTDLVDTFSMNVKCEPEKALELREHYSCVTPGYHMNKKHWNTVAFDGTVNDEILLGWIDDSYELVLASLPARERNAILG